MIESEQDAIEVILAQWDTAGLEMPNRQRGLIKKTMKQRYALSDSVVTRINAALHAHSPLTEAPSWFEEIDDWFSRKVDLKKLAAELQKQSGQRIDPNDLIPGTNSQLRHGYVDVLMLVSPLVSFDLIIGMDSFSDQFLYRMELAFLTRLDIPRNVDEAQRIYNRTLELPNEFVLRDIFGVKKVKQPYRAQMMFAALITSQTGTGNDIWQFKKYCLKNCPSWLLNYPGHTDKGTSRPSFWMSHVTDPVFVEILMDRGPDVFKVGLQQTQQYFQEKDAAASAVATDSPADVIPLKDRVGPEQRELAKLLLEIDTYLATHHPAVFEKLSPGVKDDQLDKLNQELAPLRISDDTATLYKWHNGLQLENAFFGFPEVSSIEYALRDYRDTTKLMTESSWSKAWFTFGGDSGYYLLAQLTEDVAGESPLYDTLIEDGGLNLMYESVHAMMQTILEAHQSGAINLDEATESFKVNHEAFDIIRLRHSPSAFCYPDLTNGRYEVWEVETWPETWRKYHIGHETP